MAELTGGKRGVVFGESYRVAVGSGQDSRAVFRAALVDPGAISRKLGQRVDALRMTGYIHSTVAVGMSHRQIQPK